jgi:hypothetical protein
MAEVFKSSQAKLRLLIRLHEIESELGTAVIVKFKDADETDWAPIGATEVIGGDPNP